MNKGLRRLPVRMPVTPVTNEGLHIYESLPAAEAVAKAWSEPGKDVAWHNKMQQYVYLSMPVLAKELDRLVEEINKEKK